MRWYLCDGCGARVEAEDRPAKCASCGTGTMVPAEWLRGRATAPDLEGLEAPADRAEAPEAALSGGLRDQPPAGPLTPCTTEELQDSDLVEGGGRTAPPVPALVAQSTLELDEDELEAAPTPPAPPLGPAPLIGRRIEELSDEDLEEVSPGPPPSPHRAAVPRVIVTPRALRGRVAFPIQDTDRTPLPSTLPVGVNELAVVGKPPPPVRAEARLPGQTERLATMQARRRHRSLALLGAGVAAGLVVAALWVATRPIEDQPSPGTALAAARLDQGGYTPPAMAGPDLAAANRARPDRGADRWSAEASSPDRVMKGFGRRRRPTDRPVDPVASPAAAPDVGPAVNAVTEAKSVYREGLRKLMEGDAAEAVRLFNQALLKAPRLALAYRGLGLAYEKQGSSAMAREAFERYLLLQPQAEDAEAIRRRIERLK